jgi:hypothetical protein
MILNAQNNQFIFQFPIDFINSELYEKFQKVLDNNHVPYDNVLDYLNSTIKDVVFPNLSFDSVKMTYWKSKSIEWKEAGNVFDKFQSELDITFRAVDSYINYFILIEILIEYYLNNNNPYIPYFALQILDKHGNLIYTVLFKDIIMKSMSEARLSYYQQDASEKTFTMTFKYNWIDIIWELKDEHKDKSKSIFDVDIYSNYREYGHIERNIHQDVESQEGDILQSIKNRIKK